MSPPFLTGDVNKMEIRRCPWSESHSMLTSYHDMEWGVPVQDDRKMFEFLLLESFQAGLSWLTVLKKRDNFREAFMGFDPEKVSAFGEGDIQRLLLDRGIIRNRQKISAAISNARAFLALREKEEKFASWLWGFVDGEPLRNSWKSENEIPAETELSKKISKELRSRGFSFVGPVVVYSHMQATGLVNDHLVDCFRYEELSPCNSRSSSKERSSTPAMDSM